MRKKLYAILILAGFGLAFLGGLFYSSFQTQKPLEPLKPAVLSLRANKILPKDVEISQKYIGYITPIHEANVKPFISGFIEKIYVKGGETVHAGDVLVILKQDEYISALKAAHAAVLKMKANFQNAETYYKRIQKAGKSISATELESAEAAYLSAAASLEQAKADYSSAEVNYDYTLIRAPIDGVVGDVSLTKGNYVSPSTPALLNIVQYSPIRVVFSISDKEYLYELKKEKPFAEETLKLELPNGQIFKNTGTFQYTDNSIDKKTTSIAVYADFKNIGKILTPNTYVNVLSQSKLKNAVCVQKNLVVMEDNGNFVYLIRNHKLIKERVDILATLGETFVLKNSFQKNDAIVTENVNESDLGSTVQILENKKEA